jgi:hypothetical protein
MQNRAFALRAGTCLALASLVTVLTGCSGASSALPTAGSWEPSAQTDVHHQKQLLFVSDNQNNRVLVYNAATTQQHPPPIRTISNGVHGPFGLATDKSGNLYIANSGSNTVTVYAPGASKPKMTIFTGLAGPFDVKVDGFGNIYVANDPPQSLTAFIQLYPAGSSSPSYTWSAPSPGMVISGLALLNSTQQGQTAIYAPEYTVNGSGFATGNTLSCYPGNPTCGTLGYSFGQTGGAAIAQSPGGSKPFQWIAVDQYVPGVDIFTQGQLTGQIVTGGTPEFVTLNSTGNKLYVANRFFNDVVEYSYPSGTQLNTFPAGGGQVYGVATFPAGTFH